MIGSKLGATVGLYSYVLHETMYRIERKRRTDRQPFHLDLETVGYIFRQQNSYCNLQLD